jgi:EAL domain-containing protein (putative c-di-GMP-specific phosphodiesterase class I)
LLNYEINKNRIRGYYQPIVNIILNSLPINQAFYSIRWAHSIVSVISPTESFLVKNSLEGAKRRLAVPTKKKEPMTYDLEKIQCHIFVNFLILKFVEMLRSLLFWMNTDI